MIPANRPTINPAATTAPKLMDQTIPLKVPEPIAEDRKPMASSRPCILRVINRSTPMPIVRVRPVATMAEATVADTADSETHSRSTMAAVAASNVLILIRSGFILRLSTRLYIILYDGLYAIMSHECKHPIDGSLIFDYYVNIFDFYINIF